MRVRAHVFVAGRVQGVFFRSETRQKARSANVTGWVRNLPDGRVEAVFEGEEDDVDELVRFCKKGSRGARVTEIEVFRERFTGEFPNFRVMW